MAWLNTTKSGVAVPYAKRIKLTLDGSKIEEDLTDFPVLVKLSDESGILNTDITNVFDDLYSVVFQDNFSLGGVNWIHRAGNTNYVSGYMNQTYDGTYDDSSISHFYGDDWVVKFRFKNNGYGSGAYRFYLYFCKTDSPDSYLKIYMRTYSPSSCFVELSIVKSGVSTVLHTDNSYDYYSEHGNWFWVILSRANDRILFKIWKDGFSEPTSWNYDAYNIVDESFPTIGYTRVHASLTDTYAGGTGFDDYSISIPTKRLAITSSDGLTQQYVEIESWDAANKEAWLWTKCPALASGVNTDLYLYYDKDAADNDTYVGETGSTAARNVWDDNFVAVYHMNQSPAGGTGCIKDSTKYVNNGTPVGSMTSTDLVDGVVGKCIDFDGADDGINCGHSSSLDITSAITLEAIIYPTGFDDWDRIICKSYSSDIDPWTIYELSFSNDNTGSEKVRIGITGGGIDRYCNTTSNLITLNNWHTVAGVNDGTIGEIYYGGILNASAPQSGIDSLPAEDLYIGKNPLNPSACFHGKIDEVRISNIDRSSSWIKSTYYSNWDDLITYRIYHGYIDGYIYENETPVCRTVNLHSRPYGVLVDSTTSSIMNGYYYLETTFSGSHYIVCIDDEEGESYNDLIAGRVYPTEII